MKKKSLDSQLIVLLVLLILLVTHNKKFMMKPELFIKMTLTN